MWAQKHDYIQLFGSQGCNNHPLAGGVIMNFNETPPKIDTISHRTCLFVYSSVCSDSSGHLAFYTNGLSIHNAAHHLMENGDTINPGLYWQKYKTENSGYGLIAGCFALPAPGNPHHYYLFHRAADIALNRSLSCPIYYTLIDMQANHGLGRVIRKNQIILPCYGSYAIPTAVKHGNGRDWWIISGDLFEPLIYVFLLDPTGLHGPYKKHMEYSFPGLDNSGLCIFSPDGRTYVRSDAERGLYIYDFDRCTGEFYNLRILPLYDGNTLPEVKTFLAFSPNSRYLYLSSFFLIVALDLYAPNPTVNLDTIAQFDGFSSPNPPFRTLFLLPNLAPDGKIYYSMANSTLSLHVIHNPDLPGLSADVHQHGIDIPRFNVGTMSVYPNYRLGEWEGSPCDTLNGQRPGDGFTHLPYEPPMAVQRKEGYTLLPPLSEPLPPEQAPPEAPMLDFVLPPPGEIWLWPKQLPALPTEKAVKPATDHR